MSPDASNSPTPRTPLRRSLALVALLVLLAAGIVFAQSSSGRSLLRRMHISEPPTGYVQLYFSHAHALPDYASAVRSHQRVAFVLTNDEQRTRRLRWTIATRGRRPAAQGELALGAGRSATIQRRVLIRCTTPRVEETVRLANPGESITYWLRCPSR